jgi:hypothetical protein
MTASLVDDARFAGGAWGPFQSPYAPPLGADGEWADFAGLANPCLELTQFQQYVDPPMLLSSAWALDLPDAAMALDEPARLPLSTLAANPFEFGGSPRSYLTPPLSPAGLAFNCTPTGLGSTVHESDVHLSTIGLDGSLLSPASTDRHFSEPRQPSEDLALWQGKADQPYAQLLFQCLSEADGHQMALRDIYDWFRRNTDKCANDEARGWQNSIRHNLSMNQVRPLDRREFLLTGKQGFRKVDLSQPGEEGRRSYVWRLSDQALREGIQSTTRYRKKPTLGGPPPATGRGVRRANQQARSRARANAVGGKAEDAGGGGNDGSGGLSFGARASPSPANGTPPPPPSSALLFGSSPSSPRAFPPFAPPFFSGPTSHPSPGGGSSTAAFWRRPGSSNGSSVAGESGDAGGRRRRTAMAAAAFGAPAASPLATPALSPLHSPMFSASPEPLLMMQPPAWASTATTSQHHQQQHHHHRAAPPSPLPSSWRRPLPPPPQPELDWLDFSAGAANAQADGGDAGGGRGRSGPCGGGVLYGFDADDADVEDGEACEPMEEACRNGERVSMFRAYRSSSDDNSGIWPSGGDGSGGNVSAAGDDRFATLAAWAAQAGEDGGCPPEGTVADAAEEVRRAVREMDAIVGADFGLERP